MNFVVKRCENKVKGTNYFVLGVDLGYRFCALTYDKYVIAEVLGLSVAQLYEHPIGTVLTVANGCL